MSITYVDRVEAATEETKGLVDRAGSAAQEGIDAIKKRLTIDFGKGLGLSFLQGLSFGWGDEGIAALSALAGADYEKVRDKIRSDLSQFRDQEAAISYGTEIATAFLTPGGIAKLLGTVGKPIARAMFGGGVYGAGTAEEVEDVPLQSSVGAILAGGGEAMAPVASRTAQALREAGVRVTPGQMFPAFKRAEEALTSVPIMGGGVRSAQRRAMGDFPAMMYNRALKPLGITVPKTMEPRQAARFARSAFRKKYDEILNDVEINFTDDVLDELRGAVAAAKKNLGEARKAEAIDIENEVIDEVLGRVDGEALSGRSLKEIQSILGQKMTQATKQNEMRVADAYGQVDEALMRVFAKNAPQKSKQLQALDKAYSNYIPIRKAAAASDESAFTPAKALQAVRTEERKLGATGQGRLMSGEARMQRPAEIAKSVIGPTLADSGTAGREAMRGLVLGGGGALVGAPFGMSPEGAGAALGLGLLGRGVYTPLGEAALRKVVIPGVSAGLRSRATSGLLAEQIAPSTQDLLFGP